MSGPLDNTLINTQWLLKTSLIILVKMTLFIAYFQKFILSKLP